MPARNPYPTAAAFMPDMLTMSAVREAVQRGDARRRAARRPGGRGGRDRGAVAARQEPSRHAEPRRPWLVSDLAEIVVATIHPSAVLRADDREAMFAGLVDDLRTVAAGL